MKTVATSRTAEFMALFRALESGRGSERLFDDPFALGFLRPSLRAAVRFARVPVVGEFVPWFLDRRWPGARSSGIARTKFIDDAVDAAIADGVGQVVLLGAGFDARAHRMPAASGVRVYEVDRPPTLVAKRATLSARKASATNITYVEADFDRQSVDDMLRDAGFDARRPTCFVWEGVTNYLSGDAVDATLRMIGKTAPGGLAIFTYVHRGVLSGDDFVGADIMRRTVSGVGEPWTFGFDPVDVPEYLRTRGLELLEDLCAEEYRARYWGERAAKLRGYAFYRVVRARVIGTTNAQS
jgi:methyltransferase (TIGR00027 family)